LYISNGSSWVLFNTNAADNSVDNVKLDNTDDFNMNSLTLVEKVAAAWAEINGGTAAAPSVVCATDTATGLFWPAVSTLAFSTGGVEAGRINSNQEWLIATSTDAGDYKLQVNGSIKSSASISAGETTSTGWIAHGSKSDTGDAILSSFGSGYSAPWGGTLGIYYTSGKPFNFYEGGSNRGRISTNGNWLLNTTTDDGVNKLQVNGSGKFSGTINAGGVDYPLSRLIAIAGATGFCQRGLLPETASDAGASDYFGVSCALSYDGSVLAVGAHFWDGGAGSDQGAVYVFDGKGIGL
jgi:hypothetical protein